VAGLCGIMQTHFGEPLPFETVRKAPEVPAE
jgi:hypothetical protein